MATCPSCSLIVRVIYDMVSRLVPRSYSCTELTLSPADGLRGQR